MAQQRRRRGRAQPLRDRSQRRAAGRPAADLAPAGADRHRPARHRRAPAQLPPPRRVGGGQPRTPCAPSTRGSRRRAWWSAARARAPSSPRASRRRRSWRRSPPTRCAAPARPGSARASWRSSRWPARASPATAGEAPAPPPPGLPDLAEESEAIEVRQELRRQIGRLEAELASYTARPQRRPADGAAPRRRPRRRGRGAGADPRHPDRPALGGAAGGRAAGGGRQGRESAARGSRSARQGDELVAGEAVAAGLGPASVVLRARWGTW